MTDMAIPFGVIEKKADCFVGRLSRTFAHPSQTVWQLLSSESGIPLWLAPGKIDHQLGGRAHIDFADSGVVIDSEVSAFVDGKLLEYSWSNGEQPKRPLRFELNEQQGETTLNLTVSIPLAEDPAKACAGFEAHLEMLATALEGVPTKFPFLVFKEARAHYSALLDQ